MTNEDVRGLGIIDVIPLRRAEKAAKKAEMERRLAEAVKHAAELTSTLRQWFEDEFPPESNDIPQDELDAMSQDERAELILSKRHRVGEIHIATLTGEIPLDEGEPIKFAIASQYPRRHQNPNNPSYIIDVDELDDVFTVGTQGGSLASKSRHSNIPDNVVVGRSYPTYPDRHSPAFTDDILWYKEFLDHIAESEIQLTPRHYWQEKHS